MAFVGVALDGSVVGANPVRGVLSILKAPLHYAVAVIVLGVAVVISALLSESLEQAGMAGVIAGTFVSLYFLVVEARILGLFYYHMKDRLSWFGE